MKRLLYVGHSYHVKTGSTGFLIDLLKKHFLVDILADDSWKSGKQLDIEAINNGSYDAIVFFQLIPRALINRITCKNITFFPMYDGCDSRDQNFWYDIRKCKIANFSRTLHDDLSEYGFKEHYLQYFPEPYYEALHGKLHSGAFFWQRRNAINWSTIKSLIGNECIGPIHIHRSVDPGEVFDSPSQYEELRYSITYSDWFATRAEYIEKVKSRKIYFAPRPREGVGLSFLEAMALGRAVIAPNSATMNEYIKNGVNGYLYDMNNLSMIDLRETSRVCEAAFNSIVEGRKKWEEGIKDLIEFINEPSCFASGIKKYRRGPKSVAREIMKRVARRMYKIIKS